MYVPRAEQKRQADKFMRNGWKITIVTNPPDTKILRQSRCPECESIIAFYTDGIQKEHSCTVCNRTVFL
jgi:hypothetical protein